MSPKMKMRKIKADIPESQPHVIPKVEKISKSYLIVERTRTHKYNTRSSTNRINYVKTFKNAPKMFPLAATEKINMSIGTE